MDSDLVGRVQRIPLQPRNCLLPLFEAVSNSIHAVQASGREDGTVDIELRRDTAQQRLDFDVERHEPIIDIRVTDNGIGFTDVNMAAFKLLDTRHKIHLGGKGVGRLTWLKVFDRITVESVYRASTGDRFRVFQFLLPEGVHDLQDVPHDGPPLTRVTLSGPRHEYRESLRQRASTIAAALVRHFLFYLLQQACPRIRLIDGDTVLPIRADSVVERETGQFLLKGNAFTIEHIKLRSPERRQHLVYYCANARPVTDERLRHLPERPFQDAEGAYFYQAYVIAPYLDVRVNEQRTAFEIPEEPELLSDEVSYTDLREGVNSAADAYLDPELQELTRARDAKVDRVLEYRLPDLRYVREQNRTEISSIPLHATETEVEQVIGRIHLQNQRSGRDLMADFVSDLRDATTLDLATFERRFRERIERITRPSEASLASYMLYRRSIVDLYREILKKSGDQFQREAAVHKIMFPMGIDIDTSRSSLNHNLWLLDERLTYANYIASDCELRDHKMLFEVRSEERPDIVCYFNLGFSEDDPAQGDLRTVVIVELKRPGPLQSRPESPWQQVMRYILRIREGMWAAGGQKIKASDSTRFYCYIVCDPDDPKIVTMVREFQFRPVLDGFEGYTLNHEELRAYVEVVPFAKVLRDAERKHRAFFERLGLTHGESPQV